jgi:8-oxo-dGTP pyrophosphatase MutT (NUDIX family)
MAKSAFTTFKDAYAGKPTAADELTEDALEKLLKAYEAAYNRAYKTIMDAKGEVDYAAFAKQNQLFKQVAGILGEMQRELGAALKTGLDAAAAHATTLAIKHLGELGEGVTKATAWHKEYNKAYVEQVFKDNFAHVAAQTDKMVGSMKVMLRREARAVMQRAAVEGLTRRQATQRMHNDLLMKRPDFAFVDRAGRTWDSRTYFEMLGRTLMHTSLRECYTNTLANEGHDLVIVSRHGATDPCRGWEGRVLSLTGATPGYITVQEAINSRQIFHPRCKHRLLAYRPELEKVLDDYDMGLTGLDDETTLLQEAGSQWLERYGKAAQAKQQNAALQAALNDPEQAVTFAKWDHDGPNLGRFKPLNGLAFDKPLESDWAAIPDVNLGEPTMTKVAGKKASAGVLVIEPDGRVWIYEPKGHFGGYENTFSKGGVSGGLSLQQTAMKEAFEELGLKVKITGFLGDYEKSTSVTRYYVAQRIGGDPTYAGWEADSVKLVPVKDLHTMLNVAVDKQVLNDYVAGKHLAHAQAAIKAQEAEHRAALAAAEEAAKQRAAEKAATFAVKDDPLRFEDFVQIGPQKGSNEGGLFQHKVTGEKSYIKVPKSTLHAQNEYLAGELYKLAGMEVPDLTLMQWGDGRTAIASKWMDGLKGFGKMAPTKSQAVKFHEGFGVDAWLANWDVVGAEYDNIALTAAGKAFRLDAGGALLFRAQGGAKGSNGTAPFGNVVVELETMRDPKFHQVFRVFGNVSTTALFKGFKKVVSINDAAIEQVIKKAGIKGAQAQELAATLKARKQYISDVFDKLYKESRSKAKSTATKAEKVEGWWMQALTENDREHIRKHAHFREYESRDEVRMLMGKGLSREEAAAIVMYTNGTYRQWNELLREHGEGVKSSAQYAALTKAARAALTKLRSEYRYQGEVGRKLSLSGNAFDGFINKWQPGTVQTAWDLWSTSTSPTVWSGNILLRIQSKNGIQIKDFSLYKREAEVLMGPHTKYRVVEVRDNYYWSEAGETFAKALWLEEVED